MNFFFKKKPEPPAAPLELLSVHIPKSAGTSFRNTLKTIYGDKEVIRTDLHAQKGVLTINEIPQSEMIIPAGTRVCHGHFPIQEFYNNFPQYTHLPVITWLRNPAQRVISNYYYLVQQVNEELVSKSKQAGKWKRLQRTLLEFASDPQTQNRMSFFLEGKNIDDYLFVGITEDYETDLQELAKLLNWKDAPVITQNVTRNKEKAIDPEVIQQIEKWNARDMELYNYILHKKKKNVSQLTSHP